jgi:hypothetical protein
MNRRFHKKQIRVVPPAYRRAFEQLNAALEKNTPSNQTAKIQMMRRVLFGDVDKLQQSGSVQIPK